MFAFPVEDRGYACGQILHKYQLILAAIFEPLFSEPLPEVSVIVKSPIVFIVTTFDLRISKGSWLGVGSTAPVTIPELVFKLSQSAKDNVALQNYDRTISRVASLEEQRIVPYRSTASEALVERMVRAFHHLEAWDPAYEPYTFESISRRATLLA